MRRIHIKRTQNIRCALLWTWTHGIACNVHIRYVSKYPISNSRRSGAKLLASRGVITICRMYFVFRNSVDVVGRSAHRASKRYSHKGSNGELKSKHL